jgi:hypothetical protein
MRSLANGRVPMSAEAVQEAIAVGADAKRSTVERE